MDFLLYGIARALVKFFQMLPLRVVAVIGRMGGGLAYGVDARHRGVAIDNLTQCFGPEKSAMEIKALARENFKRLGETYCCAIKTAGMAWPELAPHLEFSGLEKLRAGPEERGERRSVGASEDVKTLERSDAPTLPRPQAPPNRVIAVGHFGNFELYSRPNNLLPEFQIATTYRALKQPALNR